MIRATLTSLLARKLRLVLSGIAVVLGVMAVSGAFILSDHLSTTFSSMFSARNADIDVRVTKEAAIANDGPPQSPPFAADVVDQVRAVDGVAAADPVISTEGAKILGKDGKLAVVRAPQFGESWNGETNQVELRAGRGPRAPDEVAIDANVAKQAGFHVGDTIEIITLQPKKSFQLVGIFGYSGGRDTYIGESTVAFTEATAQELLLGQPNSYTAINVTAKDGYSAEKVRDAVARQLGDGFEVKTGAEVAEESAARVATFTSTLRSVLLGFATVALFVGIFLILNTFSILIAQRTKELALFRSLGAGRGQLIAAVLAEALAIGVIASTLGLFAGLGVAKGLMMIMEANTGFVLGDLGFAIPMTGIVASYAVGVIVTVVAALVPALRASRIPPVAAMRDSATTDRPVTRLAVVGAVLTATGAGAIGAALIGVSESLLLPLVLVGVLVALVGVALLTPALGRPVIGGLGRLVSGWLPGLLGRRNSQRNPRRTAITAAALMVGITLVTGVSVLATSLKASIEELFATDVKAELIITGEQTGPSEPTFDPAVLAAVKRLPGVDQATGVFTERVHAADSDVRASAVEVSTLRNLVTVDSTAGQVRELRQGEVLVTDTFAGDKDLHVGDRLTVTTARGGEQAMRIVGTYADSDVLGVPLLLPAASVADFRSQQATAGYIKVNADADVTTVRAAVNELLRDNPEVQAMDANSFVAQQAKQIDTFVTMMYVLLALALLIAVLGIVNTLTLSIVERTKELGLVRAVGMGRGQIVGMIAVEAVLVAVFGALLGIAVGTGLGVATVGALGDLGITTVAIPWTWLVGFTGLAALIGLLAAIVPASKAVRVNVLRAIAYE